jgi:hypothetical protein
VRKAHDRFRLTREAPVGNAGLLEAEKSAVSGTNCRSKAAFASDEGYHFIGFFAMARRLLTNIRGAHACPFGVLAMLPAIGAAAAALDAVQSLMSPQASSSKKSSGFASILSNAEDSAAILSSGSTAGSGFGGSQISSDNINALFDAQSLTSSSFAEALDSGSSSSDSSKQSQSASSTYSAINQLAQSGTVLLGLSPVSLQV